MDIKAGAIIDGTDNLDSVAETIMQQVCAVASGIRSKSEALGHQEFDLPYKRFAIDDRFTSGRICG